MADELPAKKADASVVKVNGQGVQVATLADLLSMAATVYKSGIAPESFKSAEQVFVAMQTGMEAGITPMAALNAICVVKGRATWYSDAAKGRVMASPVCDNWQEGWAGDGDAHHAWVETSRRGKQTKQRTAFSVAQAKRRGLWGKAGEWTNDPENQLMHRARGRHVTQWWGDVVLNLHTYEEIRDADWPDKSEPEKPSTPDPLLEVQEAEIEDKPKGELFGEE